MRKNKLKISIMYRHIIRKYVIAKDVLIINLIINYKFLLFTVFFYLQFLLFTVF